MRCYTNFDDDKKKYGRFESLVLLQLLCLNTRNNPRRNANKKNTLRSEVDVKVENIIARMTYQRQFFNF